MIFRTLILATTLAGTAGIAHAQQKVDADCTTITMSILSPLGASMVLSATVCGEEDEEDGSASIEMVLNPPTSIGGQPMPSLGMSIHVDSERNSFRRDRRRR